MNDELRAALNYARDALEDARAELVRAEEAIEDLTDHLDATAGQVWSNGNDIEEGPYADNAAFEVWKQGVEGWKPARQSQRRQRRTA